MNKSKIKLIIQILIITLLFVSLASNVYALDPEDSKWDPKPSLNGSGEFISRSGKILGWIQYIGIIVAVVALTIIGLKYMFGSIEQKAEYKKTMLPYIIGCFMLVAISLVIGTIAGITENRSTTSVVPQEIAPGITELGGDCPYCGTSLLPGQIQDLERKGQTTCRNTNCGKTIYANK